MFTAALPLIGTAAAWRAAARSALSNRIEPGAISWHWNSPGPAPDAMGLPPQTGRPIRLPKDALALTDAAIWHSDPARFALAYRLLWQASQGPKAAPDVTAADLERLRGMRDAALRCQARLQRALRFHRLAGPGPRPIYGAWTDPDHPVLEPLAQHWARRFEDLPWVIVTPRLSVHGRDGTVRLQSGAAMPDWTTETVAALQARSAPRRPAPSRPAETLFPEPLPLQPRPDRRPPALTDR